MRYAINLAQNFLIFSFKFNYTPLFFEGGELMRKMKIVDHDRNTIMLKKITGDQVGQAYVRPSRAGSPVTSVTLHVNVKGLDIETPKTVSIEPIPGGLKLHINKPPDLGREPAITPIAILRKRFRRPKTILESSARGLLRVFLTKRQVRDPIIANGFTALSHVGGAMFEFVTDPLKYRAPYIPIVHKRGESNELIYANIPMQLVAQLGMKGARIACYDFIQSISNKYFLRLITEPEC